MKFERRQFYTAIQHLKQREEGQDLIDYALVVAQIALAATAGINSVAIQVSVIFTNIISTLNLYVS